jgi:MoaA/NifB/PqqE/SkfB family radical SAM enzyme
MTLIDRFKERASRTLAKNENWNGETFPRVVLLDTCSFCNLKCSMCGHRVMTRRKGRMRENLFERVIDEIAEVNPATRVWMVFFGEALILKKVGIYDMIAYAKGRGLKEIVLNSNGLLLDKEATERLIDVGLDAVYVGIDAFSSETYAKLRVRGDYSTVVENVNRTIQMVRQSSTKKPRVIVQFVEMEENEKEKDRFVAYWKKQGATVKVRPKVSWAGTVEAGNLTATKRYPCHWVMDCAVVAWDGRVVLCAVDYDGRVIAGDVNHQSLQSVWQGYLRRMRDMHQKEPGIHYQRSAEIAKTGRRPLPLSIE